MIVSQQNHSIGTYKLNAILEQPRKRTLPSQGLEIRTSEYRVMLLSIQPLSNMSNDTKSIFEKKNYELHAVLYPL